MDYLYWLQIFVDVVIVLYFLNELKRILFPTTLTDYIIVKDTDFNKFSSTVREKIKDGWYIGGEMKISEGHYLQPLIK